jgi:hypothetical protein
VAVFFQQLIVRFWSRPEINIAIAIAAPTAMSLDIISPIVPVFVRSTLRSVFPKPRQLIFGGGAFLRIRSECRTPNDYTDAAQIRHRRIKPGINRLECR